MSAWTNFSGRSPMPWTRIVACVLIVLMVGMLSVTAAFAADDPQKKKSDPCENYRRPRGVTDDKSSASLVEHAARAAAGDQSVLMGGRGPAADYAVDLAALEALTPQGKFMLCWFAELEGNLKQMDRTFSMYEHAYRYCLNKPDKLAQVETDKRMVRVILEHMPSFASPSLRSRGSSGWILFYQWEVRDFTNTKEFKMFQRWLPEVQQHLSEYQSDLKPFQEQLQKTGVCTDGKPSTFEYRVFLAGNDVLVGQSDVLKATPSCRLKGWGVDCKTNVGDALQKNGQDLYPVSGQYNTMEEATRFYCAELQRNADSKKAVPLTGGRDWTAKLAWSDKPVGISNAPSCPEAKK